MGDGGADEVLVVGAGPVGLTAACQLARLGVRPRVVETLAIPTTESRAVAVQARNMEMLAALGVLDRLEERGRRIPGLEISDGRTGRTHARMEFGEIPSRHPYMLDLPQPDTEAALAERAVELGVVVERGVTLTTLTQDDDGVDVTLRSASGAERTARFGWVVGADGGHSTVRAQVGTTLHGSFVGQHFAMADVDVETTLSLDTIRMFTHPDGPGMLFPMAGTRARVLFQVAEPGDGDPTLAQIQALAEARMGGAVNCSDPRWLTYFEIHHAQIPRYRFGRVLLGGDAAHVHSPAGAQGMNTGMQDAANLAWKLALVARGRADAALLDTYHDERHPVGADVVRQTTTLTNIGTATGAEAVVRNLAFFVVGHVRRIGEAAATKTAELTVAYPHSSLSVQHGRGVRAGDHAPDPAGTSVAVEQLLARPGFTLLVFGPADLDRLAATLGELGTVVPVVTEADRGVGVVDADGVLAHAYGLGSGGLALIRPDGYLGLVADSADDRLLHHYLQVNLHVGSRATA
ncbi:2-polyprenyl-6-methoxyphenol hydroxylase-like FAD-dependent oxidoreductase [Pseudonocardia endophytica]|uniref:2-polyprenyl-6-methoxyphenol hydroxylase-like FAD-dependent oxidoreductase n=2 Tax=Pseudonocardia endophytica TaxID=401976 RepID=A0A4V2PHD2_PSEEN|nr:2-polyprenyl-6-methoxyphenol hydroxylase-like FAD-dependent oxidoreductase [Pseudonocardia endophytica]